MTGPVMVTASWRCPTCRRPVEVTATQADADVALAAVREHHETGHRAAARARNSLLVPSPRTGPMPRVRP